MTPILLALALLAATCLVVGAFLVHLRPRRNKGFLEISPQYRSFFRQLGATEPARFLDLAGEMPHIVSGHPDRNVARIHFEAKGERWNGFLKREHRVSWRTRVRNALAGFGLSSRSLREARLLQMLQREGLPGPEWLAAGEDEEGRAFLLVREAPGIELRSILSAKMDLRRRRRIARKLGTTVARLHTAGFQHPDLYANHVFIDPANDSIHLLDWQRARLRQILSWRQRLHDLAILHATLDDSLATPEERLLCLRAYWRSSFPFGVSWRKLVREVESKAKRLLSRRHIREKRQPPVPPQVWICLKGEGLCITPVLQERCGEQLPDYLLPRSEASTVDSSLRRRWPDLPGAGRVLLVQRKQPESHAAWWPRPRRSHVSPEQRQAELLLRLQRHNIAAPQVLALGRCSAPEGSGESFLLTQPFTDTCSLEVWIANRMHRRARLPKPKCWSVLRQAGALLRRLHEASCYLAFASAGCGLAVCRIQGQLKVVLDNMDSVMPQRRQQSRQALRDLRRMQSMLRSLGCSRSDLCRFLAGYRGTSTKFEGYKWPVSDTSPKRRYPQRFCEASLTELDSPRREGDSFWRRLLWGVRRLCHRSDWPCFAGEDWADRIMEVPVTDHYHAKQGRSTGRWIVTGPQDGQKPASRLAVFLKRHYELPWWRCWLATMWPWRNWSPAWQEGKHLQWARRQGFPVPRMVAAAEYIGPWGKLRSFLAVEELAGMASLQEAIPLAAVRQDARSFRQWKRGLAAEMARLTRMLHDRRCFHKDLYLCHFFIARDDTRSSPAEGWRGRLNLIDLHRLGHHPLTWRLWQTKDLAEILYSSEIIGVDARDRLAFWRAYRGDGPHRPRFAWMRHLIRYRWRRYRHHNEQLR